MSEPRTSEPVGEGAPSQRLERFGKYELLRKLAEGGMAEIFLARASGIEGFEKLVVIKRILPTLASNPEFIRMFLDEGRLAAGLHHSNIVQVYEIGSVGGGYYMAMEFVPGEDLRHVMRATLKAKCKALPLEHAIAITNSLLSGLHHAHEKLAPDGTPLGIVHRDVSPQNVIVTYDGNVKLLDFGIAKATHRLNQTRTGSLKGKVRYMSPEQCQTAPVDRRTDVFAATILLWEMTVGRRLYDGESEFLTMKQIVEADAPTPSSVMPGYPPELEAIVMRGLRRNPEERYQSAQDLQLALEEFARERKLPVSSVALARYMRQLFGPEIDAWQTALRRGGTSLEQQVAERFEDSGGSLPDVVLHDILNPESTHTQASTRVDKAKVSSGTLTNPTMGGSGSLPVLRRSSRTGLFVASGGALAAFLLLGIWLWRSNSPADAAPPPVPLEAVAPPPSPAPATPIPPAPAPSAVVATSAKQNPPESSRATKIKKRKPLSARRVEPTDLDAPLPP